MEHNTINIVAASDNYYAVLLGALIKSIEVNHKTGEKINFYIIDDGISPANRKKIEQSGSAAMFTFFWQKTKDVIPPTVKIPADKSAFPITTYLRLFAPYIIPETATRVIYLDVDMILMEDISKLWYVDIGDKVIGAAMDLCETVGSQWGGIPNYKELGFDGNVKYFNAGMQVMNPIKWRAQDLTNKVIKDINDNMAYVNFPDQYGLNVALYNKWFELDQRWNCFAALKIEKPWLIHYLDIKPIFTSYNSNEAYKKDFYTYLELTPWKGFTPISDYRRVIRKATIKIKKLVVSYFRNK
jgi:lipopolysaccharide biosynthesis glycosyltransferase